MTQLDRVWLDWIGFKCFEVSETENVQHFSVLEKRDTIQSNQAIESSKTGLDWIRPVDLDWIGLDSQHPYDVKWTIFDNVFFMIKMKTSC